MKGETIKEKLSLLGKTQKELAGLLGITPQAVYEILSSSDVRSSTIEKIAQALKVPVTFFFEDQDTTISSFEEHERGKIRSTYRIGIKVRALLKKQNKKLVGLCEYVGMTEAGMRKVFERDTCNISALVKIAEYLGVSVNHFLPQSNLTQEFNKDKEIEYLKGQVRAYENALKALTPFSREAQLSFGELG